MKRFVRTIPIQIFLVLWTILALVPFILITLLAFRSQQDIFRYPLGVGGDFTIDNFVIAWAGPAGSGAGMAGFLENSVVIAVVALVTAFAIGTPAAYFAHQLPPRTRRWFLRVFLLSAVVPLILLVIPYFQIAELLNTLNNPAALGFTYGVLALPTTVLVMFAFFGEFPQELVEAAAIDGLGPVSTFVRIVLPLSRPGLVAVSLLTLIFAWGESQLAVPLLQDPASQNVPVAVLGFQGQFTTQLGPIFAGLTIAAVPIIIIYLVFSRFITKGIALGGVFR